MHTNGRTRAVLYARVSTREQSERGYSLRQQIESLREFAATEGYDVAAEVEDPGYSGAYLERPGLERVRDLVEAGGVDLAIAQDMDRWSRDPAHMLLLEREFAVRGCELQALDNWSDASPQADMLRTIRSAVSRFERDLISERSRRNKRKKAREGRVVGGHPASYGFAFAASRDGYVVDETTMPVVRRIFRAIAVGTGIRTLKTTLGSEGVPTPGGGAGWSRPFIRTLVLDDLYLPHTVEELRSLGVAGEVLGRLDANRSYGVYRFKDIAVPIPDAGIPREVVMAARAQIKDNRSPSRAGHRFWTLSGGILRCAMCGRAMQAFTVPKRDGRGGPYYYYRCRGKYEDVDRCTMRKNLPAEATERKVLNAVLDVVKDRDELIRKANEDFEDRRRSLMRSGGADGAYWQRKLLDLDAQRMEYVRQAARGRLSDDHLDALLSELDAQKAPIEQALREYKDRAGLLAELEEVRDNTVRLIRDGKWAELGITDPQARHQRYREIGLRVEASPDGALRLSWGLGHELAVSNNETSPLRPCTRTTPRAPSPA